MTTAEEIAHFYDFTESSDGFIGDCPCCGYRGFSLTERDGRVLFYCHGGGCEQEEIIERFREADLWGAGPPESEFEILGDEPKSRHQPHHPPKDDSRDAALDIWRRSSPAESTIVETYLRVRGYRGPIPASMRYVAGKHPSDDVFHPIMVGAVIRPDNPPSIIGVHRTFLLPNGSGKAALNPNKMSLGPIGGGGVPLGPPGPRIAVSEGIESGLSFMQATEIPTWAALSANGMKKLLLPPEVREVVIAADADETGLEAAEEAASRWHAEGRKVRIIKPPEGLDFNDLARAP
jgi:putative DNA primase/helicase